MPTDKIDRATRKSKALASDRHRVARSFNPPSKSEQRVLREANHPKQLAVRSSSMPLDHFHDFIDILKVLEVLEIRFRSARRDRGIQ